jgi:sterol desaturase/sphingolipid hydroxylase (fatty acid hydroxylase superfamily)
MIGDVAQLLEFLALWAAVYAAHIALYFGQGALMDAINRRHPDRRIQQARRGEERKRVEIRQSLKALVVISGCVAGGLWLPAHGVTLWPPFAFDWVWTPVMFVVSVVLFDAWFYWGHRLMHTKRLYRHHFWHHRSVAPTVWSNYSDSLPDAFAMQSYYLIMPLLLPIPPEVLILHRLWDHVNGQIGHSGFEYFADRTTRFPSPMVCVTFHDQHHEHFRYNYANFFSFWDRLCGTLHPDYDRRVAGWSNGERAPAGDGRPAPP